MPSAGGRPSAPFSRYARRWQIRQRGCRSQRKTVRRRGSSEIQAPPQHFLRDCSRANIGDDRLELHSRLVGSGEPIPTILTTAFPDERARERALQAGVICYLTKPFRRTSSSRVFARLSDAAKHVARITTSVSRRNNVCGRRSFSRACRIKNLDRHNRVIANDRRPPRSCRGDDGPRPTPCDRFRGD